MALQKLSLDISFAQGVDTKTDPKRVSPGRFLSLENTVFNKVGLLEKRNGFGALADLPDTNYTTLSALNGGLLAFGTSLAVFSDGANEWVPRGRLSPINVSSMPLMKSGTNQGDCSAAVSDNGLVCTTFRDDLPSGAVYKYSISDLATGNIVIDPTLVVDPAEYPGFEVVRSVGVYAFATYFVLIFVTQDGGTFRLQMRAINVLKPSSITAMTAISNQFGEATDRNFAATILAGRLFVAWNGSDTAVHAVYFNSMLQAVASTTYAGAVATSVAISVDSASTDEQTARVFIAYYDSVSKTGYIAATSTGMVQLFAPIQWIDGDVVGNITLSIDADQASIIYEVQPPASAPYLIKKQVYDATGSQLFPEEILIRGVGLASQAFSINEVGKILVVQDSDFQPTYFLYDIYSHLIAKLAYSNAGGYVTGGLPDVTVIGDTAYVPYLKKDLLQSVPKSTVPDALPNVYSQTGVSLATFKFDSSNATSIETANGLHVSGGILWLYDSTTPVEHGFMLWPEGITRSISNSLTTGLAPGVYYYAVTYEWTDAAGNIHQSAPSIPLLADLSALPGDPFLVELKIPTLRLTYKIDNPVRIVIYRWSQAQQIFYQITSVTSPLLNDTTVDTVTYLDDKVDADILGARILYTTGGVLENIAAPATNLLTIFQSRMFLVDAENPNLIWFSKQVIDSTPVELSDLLTIYLPPALSAQGNTGPITALSSMDDKLIIFKKNAIYYVVGVGPDNAGVNNQFSDPTFVTSTVGCISPNSIVFTPDGLMFQSDKGIWLLTRGLATMYLGAPVEEFNDRKVLSAIVVPGTNQVRFTLDDGTVLMYDYFFKQWGTFMNVPAISSIVHGGLHTFINAKGMVFQETPGVYRDGSSPVLMAFTTGWMNLAGLQGYERFYACYLLGEYLSPFKLNVGVAYDYNPSVSQETVIVPDNYNSKWGKEPIWGDGETWGGKTTTFEARMFPARQKCEAFQLVVKEIYDAGFPNNTGAGLTLSGLNLILGMKRGYRTSNSSRNFG